MKQLRMRTQEGKIFTAIMDGFGPAGNSPSLNGATLKPKQISRFIMSYLTSTKLFKRDDRRELVNEIKNLHEVPAKNSHLNQYQKGGRK